jgi:hypothetical protein
VPHIFNGLTGIDAFKAGIINAFTKVDFDPQLMLGRINRPDLCKKLGVLTEQNKWELSAEDILVKIGQKHTRLSEITQEDIRYLAGLRVPMLWVYLDKKCDGSIACNVM